MTETYNLDIDRNEDNVIYHFPYFNLNVTLSGEKMEPVTPEPEPETPENVKIINFNPPLTSEIQPQSTISCNSENQTIATLTNNSVANLSSVQGTLYFLQYGNNSSVVLTPISKPANLPTVTVPLTIIGLSRNHPNKIIMARIYGSSTVSTENIQLPYNDFDYYYYRLQNTSYVNGFIISNMLLNKHVYDSNYASFRITTTYHQVVRDISETLFYEFDFGSINVFTNQNQIPFTTNNLSMTYTLTYNNTIGLQTNYTMTLKDNILTNDAVLYQTTTSTSTPLTCIPLNTLDFTSATDIVCLILENSPFNRIYTLIAKPNVILSLLDINYNYPRFIYYFPNNTYQLNITYENAENLILLHNNNNASGFYQFTAPENYYLIIGNSNNINECFNKYFFTNDFISEGNPIISATPTTSSDTNSIALKINSVGERCWKLTNEGDNYYDTTQPIQITLNGQTILNYNPQI